MTRTVCRALASACCAALLLLTAQPADAAARDRVLTGTVVDQSGNAVAGARVAFEDEAAFTGFFGLICLFAFPVVLVPGGCLPNAATATTDTRGRYALRLKAGSALNGPGLRHLFVAGRPSSAGPARPGFTGDLALTASTRGLATVVLWSQAVRLTRADGRTQISVTRPKGASGSGSVTLRGDDNKGVAYEVPFKDDHADVDDRVFEDGTRSVDVTASGTWSGKGAYWSSASQLVSTVGRPASRGLACSTYAAGGALGRYRSCPFTDGHLGTGVGLITMLDLERDFHACHFASECRAPNALVYDLGSIKLLQAVVWRMCASCSDHPIQLSVDGSTWIDWVNQKWEGSDYASVTGATLPVRYLRIQGSAFVTWDLRELSVWAAPLLPV